VKPVPFATWQFETHDQSITFESEVIDGVSLELKSFHLLSIATMVVPITYHKRSQLRWLDMAGT
jgi:hypothetical protein